MAPNSSVGEWRILSLPGLLHPWGQDMMFMALSTRRCTHEDKCLLYAKALYQIPVSGFLYTLSEGVSRCRRLIRTGGYALAHLSPFFENISPNKFRSDIFSNCETSQSPCCGERGLSDQWRMWPLLFLETRGNPETHKVALPPHQTRSETTTRSRNPATAVLDCYDWSLSISRVC